MTDERKRYIAGISKEERTIRELIKNSKRTIKHYKILMNEDKEDTEYINDVGKPQIAIRKFLIKALKKQLPARVKKTKGFYDFYSYDCSVCGTPIETFNDKYCGNCGQKLR